MTADTLVKIGLTDRDLETLHDIFNKFPTITEVYIFGSRVRGNYTHGSDIDLAIMNPIEDTNTIHRIITLFQDSSLPYFVDLLYFPAIKNVALKNNILIFGLPIYRK